MADGNLPATITMTDPSTGQQARVPFAANCMPVCAPSKDYLTPGRFSVNNLEMMEAITQPLYSFQLFPAGATILTFFQNPTGGAATTLQDTNMLAAGALPAPQKFMIQGIGVEFLSGLAATTLGADTANSILTDFWHVMRTGVLTLTIGEKNYLQMASLKELPVRGNVRGDVAIASQTTPAAGLQTFASVAYADGDVYQPIPMLLEASQNFRCTITFPNGAVTLPSGNATSRIGVKLYGTQYRAPQ